MLLLLLIVCFAALGFGAGGCASADGKSIATAEMGSEVVRDNINGGKTNAEVEAIVADVKAKIDKAVAGPTPAELAAGAVDPRVNVEVRKDILDGIEKQIRSLTLDPLTRQNLEDYFKAASKYERSK
jgi:hypothetical protein